MSRRNPWDKYGLNRHATTYHVTRWEVRPQLRIVHVTSIVDTGADLRALARNAKAAVGVTTGTYGKLMFHANDGRHYWRWDRYNDALTIVISPYADIHINS